MNDVIVDKIQSIQRCVKRARDEYLSDREGFAGNFTVQDAALLNVLRACEQAIDLANHVVRIHKLGVPTSSGQSFEFLAQQGIVDAALCERLKRMAHFRNLCVHDYQSAQLASVESVITTGLDDLLALGNIVRALDLP